MDFTIEEVGDIAVVLLPGETLDVSNGQDFRHDVAAVLEGKSKVIFDMTAIRFIDSSGCGALLSCLRNLKAHGGSLKICGVSKPVRSLLELIRMHRVLDIFDTREEAVGAF